MSEIVKICKKHGELTIEKCRKIIEKRWGIQPNYKYTCLLCIKNYNQNYLHKLEYSKMLNQEPDIEFLENCTMPDGRLIKEVKEDRKKLIEQKVAK